MQLSSEDTLRLNVLLANKPLAIRIHESSMTLYGLLPDGEARVGLNPQGREEQYLKAVRAFLSERALGSPGGYPLYLQRWTRQGQMRMESLEQLLMLGDPTAVFAVVCAQGLNHELARRAWWAVEEAENARRMLETPAVVAGELGQELARYLVEYLPFESETETLIESVRLALQPGLLDQQLVEDLWRRADRKTPYLVGFIAAIPDALPGDWQARQDLADLIPLLARVSGEGRAVAELLEKLLSARGQAFLDTCQRILKRPATQEVVTTTLDLIRDYLSALRPEGNPDLTIEVLVAEAERYLRESPAAAGCLETVPALSAELGAARILSGLGYGVLRPMLRGSGVMGSLMRKKLAPALEPVLEQLRLLRGS